jgi:deoxyhypusine synthase
VRLAEAAGALVMEADSWGKARTPAVKARMAMEYFIVVLLIGQDIMARSL